MFERIKTFNLNGKIKYHQTQLLTEQLFQLGNIIKPEADAAEWRLLGGSSEKSLDSTDQETLRDQSIKAYYKSAHGRNIIRLFEKYVVGRGFNIEPISTIPAVKEVWKEFWTENKMELRKKEIVRRTMRDGESFLRYFDDEDIVKIRFMNPELVYNPDDIKDKTIKDGIETDPDDIETILAYYYRKKEIPHESVQHLKIMVDSDVLRGRSYYEPVLDLLTMYKKWLSDRMKLNEIRNTVALIKKVKGSPTQVVNIAKGHETSTKTNPDGSTLHRAPKNVSVYTSNQNVDYELKSPNLQAADVQKDGRALLLAISAGSGMPEFMTTADSSNSSYASTMVAEGPAVMEFEDWQDFFAYHFKIMFTRIIEHGIKNNKIPAFETITEKVLSPITGKMEEKQTTIPISTDCSIIFPDLVARNIEKETRAYILQSNQGWISDVTASARLDLNHEDEQRLIDQQEDEEPEEDEDFEDEMAKE